MLFLLCFIYVQDPETMIHVSSAPEAISEAKKPLTAAEKKFLEEVWITTPTYDEALNALKDPGNMDQYRNYLGLRTQKETAAQAVKALMDGLTPGDPYYLKLLGFLCLLDPAAGLKPFEKQVSGGKRISFPGLASDLTEDYLPLFLEQLDGTDAQTASWAAERIAELLPPPERMRVSEKLLSRTKAFPFRNILVEQAFFWERASTADAMAVLNAELKRASLAGDPARTAPLFARAAIWEDLQGPASDLLHHHLTRHPKETGAYLPALDLMQEARFSSLLRAPLLKAWQDGNIAKEDLLGHLALHLGKEAAPLVLPQVQDEDTYLEASHILGFLGEKTADPAYRSALRKVYQQNDDPWEQDYLLLALARVGGEEAFVLEALEKIEKPDFRALMLAAVQGRGWMELADDLVKSGLMSRKPDIHTIYRVAFEELNTPYEELMYLLETVGQAFTIDVEADFYPVPHHELVNQLAAITSGALKPEFSRQRLLDVDGTLHYQVSFINQDRVYSFQFEEQRDWYVVPPVVEAVNRALQDINSPKRVIMPKLTDQTASYVFARQEDVEAGFKSIGFQMGQEGVSLEQARAQEQALIKALSDKLAKTKK